MKKIILLLVIASVYAINPALAQIPSSDTTTMTFIVNASIGNLQEIASGKLAEQRATSADVKAFASHMVMDHTQAQTKLMHLIHQKGYHIPGVATLTPVPDAMLAKAPGKRFDQLYVHAMVDDHRNTINLFQNYAISGNDPDLKAFAQQTLTTLKQHLASIQVIDNKITQQLVAENN